MKTRIIILSIICIIITGCYNYREINDLAIASALGIDKNTDTFKVVAQIVNTQKSGGAESSNSSATRFSVFTNENDSLQEAYRNILNETGKKLYINHLTVIVISEEVAKNGISNILDLFSRDYNFRKQVLVIISKDSAEKTLSLITSTLPLNSENIKEILINNEKFIGNTTIFTLEDLLKSFLSKNIELVIPTFNLKNATSESDNSEKLKESNIESKLKFYSNAVFKKDKLIGYLNDEENLAFNIIKGNIKNALIKLKCNDKDEEYIVIELMNTKTDFKNNKGTLDFEINYKGEAVITELNCNINIEKLDVINNLEKKLNDNLKKTIEKTIKNVTHEFNSDIFGFRELIYKNDSKFYNKIKDKFYEEKMNKIEIKVKTTIKIKSHGNLMRSIKK